MSQVLRVGIIELERDRGFPSLEKVITWLNEFGVEVAGFATSGDPSPLDGAHGWIIRGRGKRLPVMSGGVLHAEGVKFQRRAGYLDDDGVQAWDLQRPRESLLQWLRSIGPRPGEPESVLRQRVEELIGVVDHLIVQNRDLEAWASALTAEVAEYRDTFDAWELHARDLRLVIAELEAKNNDLRAQLAQARGLKKSRLQRTVEGLAIAVTLLQAPAAIEDVGQRLGLVGKEPSQPPIPVIINEISTRCDVIVQQAETELPERE